jgi:hypothetical protein
MRILITRSEARDKGLVHYFTGKSCKNGHIALRTLSNGACVCCSRTYTSNFHAKHSHKQYSSVKQWHNNHTKYDTQWHVNYNRIWRKNNPHKTFEYQVRYRLTHYNQIVIRRKVYYQTHKSKYRAYQNNKRRTDPLFKLASDIRTLIRHSMLRMGFNKAGRTAEILGCSFEEFKTHIENQFIEGMSWNNHGEWHYDHIYPVALARDESHLVELNHYTNFQPLWAIDNIKKGCRYTIENQ